MTLAIEFYSGYINGTVYVEVKQNFPSTSNTSVPTCASVPSTSDKTPTPKTSRLPATKIPKVVDLTQPQAPSLATHEVCYVCGKRHPTGCVIQAHPDASCFKSKRYG